MADIKTHYRELSFAIKMHSLIHKEALNKNIFDSKIFFEECKKRISNPVEIASNIIDISMNYELQNIIKNGFKLANEVYMCDEFKFDRNSKVYWIGSDLHKKNLTDVIVDKYSFSLKENSFILENMGLYKYLKIFTNYKGKTVHVFKDFALKEYNNWFMITWNLLLSYLEKHDTYVFSKNNYKSIIKKDNKNIIFILFYNNIKLEEFVPVDIKSWNDFMFNTSSKIREKVFAKWINEKCSFNEEYKFAKYICSKEAGKNLVYYIKQNFNITNLERFLQIYDEEYYYAKVTEKSIEVYKVPASIDFKNIYEVLDIKYEVPSNQLNLITTIINKITKEQVIFRNECRFSHGQFNGTPEAKMYYDKGKNISILYSTIISKF